MSVGNPSAPRGVAPLMRKILVPAVLALLGGGVAHAQPPPGAQPVPEPKKEPPPAAQPGPGAAQPAPKPAPKKASKPGQKLVVDKVVAIVNDAVILHSELMRRVAPLTADLDEVADPRERKRRQDKLKGQVLDEMVNEELIVQSAGESKLDVSAKEVQNALEEIKKQNNLDDNQLAEAQRMRGYTMSG